MELSEISKVVGPTLSRKIYMMSKQYDDVVDFTLGDPDIPTHKSICEAAYKASLDGNTRYSPNAGLLELRDAISKKYSIGNNANYSANNVAISVGATEAFFLTLQSILNEGDEVIIIEPYWVQYENIVKLNRAVPVIVTPRIGSLEPHIDDIVKAITNKTKAIIVNSPNNPSGVVYSSSLIEEISNLSVQKNFYVISDEVYKSLVYESDFNGFSNYLFDNLIIINSFSKEFSMTGWRVGYIIANYELINTIIKMQQNVAVCPSTISQFAAIEAINNIDFYSSLIREEFRSRRNVLVQNLSLCPHLHFDIPKATFYSFIDISELRMGSYDFCINLLEKEQVAVIPGIAFGSHFDTYIRLAFTMNENKIKEGVNRITNFVQNYYNNGNNK